MLSKINSDQAFSFLNTVLTVLGTLLATNGALSNDMQQLVMGAVTTLATFAVAWWFNAGNIADQATSALRKLLVVFGTYATARGWVTAEQVQSWSGPVMTVAAMVWSWWFYRDDPGPNLPGTTIVDEPK